MGRWAQKNRRGGSAPLTPAIIIDVHAIGSQQADVTFSRPITVITAGAPSSSMNIGGAYTVQSVAALAPGKARVTFTGVFSSGVAWNLLSQPPFIRDVVQFPANGTTS